MGNEAQVINEALIFYSGDSKNINHFMKVYSYARIIGIFEGLDERNQEIVEVAAIVHGMGKKICIEKYGELDEEMQEKECVKAARRLLERIKCYDEDFVQRVCELVGSHLSYGSNESEIDFQILVEADLLVNIDEEQASIPEIRRVQHSIFKTEAGMAFLQNLFYKD